MRVLFFTLKLFIVCAVLIGACVWLADQPGDLAFTWRGAQVQMQTSVALILVLVLCMVLWKVGKLFFWLKYGAARRLEARRRKRDRQGLDLLTASFNALAARDLPAAAKAQKRAQQLLGDASLATWLGAQIAVRQEHGAAARQSFLALTATPNAANLGWRGLMGLQDSALPAPLLSTALSNKATARQPYLHEARLADAIRTGNWMQARTALNDAARAHALSKPRLRRLEQVVLMERAIVDADPLQARLLLEQAYKLDPSFTPAALALVDRLLTAHDSAAAGKLLGALFLTMADDEAGEQFADGLLSRFVRLHDDETALARLQRFERLAKKRAHTAVTLLAMARLNMDAEQWRYASDAIAQAQDIRPTRTAYRLLAELALLDPNGKAGAAQFYADRAHDAALPVWRCTSCQTPYADWQVLCDSCGIAATVEPAHGQTAPLALI